MQRLKIFISYSHRDGIFAGKLKYYLETYTGFEVFLAHDDLALSDEFLEEIWEKLTEADIVIPIISPNLKGSFFSNQEIGIAKGRNQKIVPVCIDGEKPYAFIDHKQGYICADISSPEICDKDLLTFSSTLYRLALKHPSYKTYQEKAMNSIVYALGKSPNFAITSAIIAFLIETHLYVRFSEIQIEALIEGAKGNSQVHTANYLFPKLKNFLQNEYNKNIDL